MAEPDPNAAPPAPAAPTINPIIAALDPYASINPARAEALKQSYGADLTKVQGALSTANKSREDITTQNLRAIDEAISGLRNSRYDGMIGLDPAVSAAMAAGLLKTTPGVAGNFMTELGQGMGNAAPIIAAKQKGDRDSFSLLAELQRKRGEFEAEPVKETQAELRAREKEIMANIKEVDKGLLRAPTDAAKAAGADEKRKLDQQKIINAVVAKAQADAAKHMTGKMKADGTPLSVSDMKKIEKYLVWDQIRDNNVGKNPGDIGYIDPGPHKMEQPEEDEARKMADDAIPDDKGASRDYNEYKRSLKPGDTPMAKPEWEAQNAAKKATTLAQAKELETSIAALPATLATIDDLKSSAQALKSHPGLNGITGNLYGAEINKGTNTDEVAALAIFKQLQAIEFLKAIPNMKGMGQLTEVEGAKLQASQNRLARRMSTSEFRAELDRIVTLADRLTERLKEKAGQHAGSAMPPEGTVIKGATGTHTVRNGKWDPPL